MEVVTEEFDPTTGAYKAIYYSDEIGFFDITVDDQRILANMHNGAKTWSSEIFWQVVDFAKERMKSLELAIS